MRIKSILVTAILSVYTVSAAEIVREPGKNGLALRLRSGEYAESFAGSELNCPNGYTVSFWVKAEEWGQKSSLVYKGGSYGVMKRGDIGVYFWGHFSTWDTVNMSRVPEKYALENDRWYHLAMTYDAETTRGQTFLNGVLTGSDIIRERQPQLGSYKIFSTDRTVTIGKGMQPFGGLIDSVYIYDRALSVDEIRRLMQEDTVPGAKLAWLFNEDDKELIRDSSGNGYDARFISERMDPNAEEVTTVEVPVLAEGQGLTAWAASSAQKVFRRHLPAAARPVQDIQAAVMARNEYESFQVVLSAGDKAVNINRVHVSSLKGPGDAEIPAEAITVNKVEYVPLDTPSQTITDGREVMGEAAIIFNKITSKPGFYPDPLPKLELPLSIDSKWSVPLWITVHTPKDVPGEL